jgi:enoyl-CoA hydratase/carnithine racemase
VADDPMAAAEAFAETLVSRSQLTIRSAKETVSSLLAGEDAESAAYKRYQETISSGELTEGVRAFTEKRTPQFGWK